MSSAAVVIGALRVNLTAFQLDQPILKGNNLLLQELTQSFKSYRPQWKGDKY